MTDIVLDPLSTSTMSVLNWEEVSEVKLSKEWRLHGTLLCNLLRRKPLDGPIRVESEVVGLASNMEVWEDRKFFCLENSGWSLQTFKFFKKCSCSWSYFNCPERSKSDTFSNDPINFFWLDIFLSDAWIITSDWNLLSKESVFLLADFRTWSCEECVS